MIDNGDDDNDNDEKTDMVRHNMRAFVLQNKCVKWCNHKINICIIISSVL